MNLKQLAASQALAQVEDGMVLGLGSGSTASCFIDLLGERLHSGALKNIRGVPTSETSANQARRLQIPIISLADCISEHGVPELDLAVDGADEIDSQLNLIKGLGHALLREKMVEMHAHRFVVIADESKIVQRLGSRVPLPVEIVQFAVEITVHWLGSFGCRAELWLKQDGAPIVTENGNYLVRCWFPDGIQDLDELALQLKERPGVVEHGLFLKMATQAVIAGAAGTRILERNEWQ
jgi:ribose 5-phosphate isomerase A